MGTDVLVFVTLGQNQEQTFAHLHGSTALGASEQCRFQTFERGPSLLRHIRYLTQVHRHPANARSPGSCSSTNNKGSWRALQLLCNERMAHQNMADPVQ